jgi:MFS family permease
MSDRLLSGRFLLCTIANFLFFLNFASYFLLPLHIRALGGSESTVGAVMGTAGLASLAVLPLIGMSIDRIGRRQFLLMGAVGMTAASGGFLFVERIGVPLFALRLLQGVSFAGAFTAATTFAAEFAPPRRRAQALGIFGLSTLLTHAIAPTVGEEIMRRGGFHTLVAVTMLYTAAALVVALWLPAAGASPARHATRAERRLTPAHWAVAISTTLAGMGFGTVITFVPTYVTGEGFGRVGIFFAAYTSAAILTRLIGAGLSDRLGRRRVIMPALVALAASMVWLAFVHSVPRLFAAGALFGTAQGISYPTMHAYIVDQSSPAQLGRAQALFNGAFNLGVTGSAFAFGLIAEQLGYRTMFALAAATPLAACVVFALGVSSSPVSR